MHPYPGFTKGSLEERSYCDRLPTPLFIHAPELPSAEGETEKIDVTVTLAPEISVGDDGGTVFSKGVNEPRKTHFEDAELFFWPGYDLVII